MDNATLVLTALESAMVAGGQAAVSDTVKEALEGLKNRLVQAFTAFAGRKKALMVLDAYEEDPDTWKKPLAKMLTQASLDPETIAQAQQLLALVKSQGTVNIFNGTVGNSPIGNYNTISYNNYHTPVEDKVVKGREALKRGYSSLLLEDYLSAKQYLEDVASCLHQDQFPAEVAQLKYLQTFVVLRGQRPFSTTIQNMRYIEQLIHVAYTLHPLYTYFYTLALFKSDFARNGLPHYAREAQELVRRAQQHSKTAQDQENLHLLAKCQARLFADAQQW